MEGTQIDAWVPLKSTLAERSREASSVPARLDPQFPS